MEDKFCANCERKLSTRNSKAEYCSARTCQLIKKKNLRREKHKDKKFYCEFCKEDITIEWPKRICQKKECLEKHELEVKRKKDECNKKYEIKMKKLRPKRFSYKSLNTHMNNEYLDNSKFDKEDEDFFDDDIYKKEQEEYHKPNGKICNCGEKLYGNDHFRCPECVIKDRYITAGVPDEWLDNVSAI